MRSRATAFCLVALDTPRSSTPFAWVLFASAILGCEEPDPAPLLPPSAAPATPTATASYTRRTRHYFVANDHDQCTVFWEEGMQTSQRKIVACPREIDAGERARLTGRTCIRESARKERNVPVRCPNEVFYAVRDDRGKKGEFRLPPQEPDAKNSRKP